MTEQQRASTGAEIHKALREKIGDEVEVSDWVMVDQDRIQAFADATLDQQWIHTDPVRAEKGPFGGPIAHGLLSLSLLPYFAGQMSWAPLPRMSVNYGYERVRFTAPLPADSRVRCRQTLERVDSRSDGGLMVALTCRVEREGQLLAEGGRPIVVAESLSLFYY
ncbi:MAG: dehydratase [Kiloniella sp.]|nr:dehydratase [Kiloniella sp.]